MICVGKDPMKHSENEILDSWRKIGIPSGVPASVSWIGQSFVSEYCLTMDKFSIMFFSNPPLTVRKLSSNDSATVEVGRYAAINI